MINKEALHRLVEELPDGELPTALRFLQYLKDVSDDDGDVDPLDAYPSPYARASMRDADEYGDAPELVPVERDDESVADAWRNYLASKPSYSDDYGF